MSDRGFPYFEIPKVKTERGKAPSKGQLGLSQDGFRERDIYRGSTTVKKRGANTQSYLKRVLGLDCLLFSFYYNIYILFVRFFSLSFYLPV